LSGILRIPFIKRANANRNCLIILTKKLKPAATMPPASVLIRNNDNKLAHRSFAITFDL
jgi:hypothetical protein